MPVAPPPAAGPLWHLVPRLDAPDKLGPIPAPVALSLGGGVVVGPAFAQLLALLTSLDMVSVWAVPQVWIVTAAGVLLGSVGAFVRPQGLHLGQWASAVGAYALVPRRLVWCPVVVREGSKGR